MTDATTTATEETSEKKPRRRKSTGFPVVSLPEAESVLRDAGKYGFEHSLSAFARAMGHETTNSGAFRQRLSAFRDWKLVAGRGDLISFTDIGRTLAVPPSEEARQTALRTAFMSCDLFARMYDALAKGQVLDPNQLGATAVHNYGVSPASRSKFVDSFGMSLEAAGLGETDEDGSVLLHAPDAPSEVLEDPASDPEAEPVVTISEPAATSPQTPSTTTNPAPIVVSQTWDLGDGFVHFEIRRRTTLSGSAFAAVGQAVEALEALARSLEIRPDPAGEDGDRDDP